MKVLLTGGSGLICSEAVEHFDVEGHEVAGVDNNMRRVFFGPAGDTLWNLDRLKSITKRFTHVALDIRDRTAIEELFRTQRFDLVVHCAGDGTTTMLAFRSVESRAAATIRPTKRKQEESCSFLASSSMADRSGPSPITMSSNTRFSERRRLTASRSTGKPLVVTKRPWKMMRGGPGECGDSEPRIFDSMPCGIVRAFGR
ncbi:MAG: hypothetical protein DMG54_01310 [Acidobacteria bacterium]|nr:MAG: hypothetical protein DMG54_01310 [Acidobacteriota bacterium]